MKHYLQIWLYSAVGEVQTEGSSDQDTIPTLVIFEVISNAVG
jgi:hypothetical protein